MKKATIKVYTIDELNEKAKEKAIARIKEELVEMNFEDFNDFIADNYLLGSYGIELNKSALTYSLSYSQGDGLSFTCDDFMNPTIKAMIVKQFGKESDEVKALEAFLKVGKVITEANRGHYSYARRSQVLFTFESDEAEDGFFEELKKQTNTTTPWVRVVSFVGDLYLKACGELERLGYNCYEVSDEQAIVESLDRGESYFEDGALNVYGE